MVKRKIIKINEEKCNGCGECIPNCPEGALQVIDGKARLISDLFCDGLGACIGECPLGAIEVEEREAEAYDEKTVMEKNIIPKGENVIKAHLQHLKSHGEMRLFEQAIDVLKEKGVKISDFFEEVKQACPSGGCPGSALRDMRTKPETVVPTDVAVANVKAKSQLQNWPTQFKLLNPNAPYLENADLLFAADCAPFAYADFHNRFMTGKILVNFCPKLDPYNEEYLEKLKYILEHKNIKSITMVRMEVPCCGGLTSLVENAVRDSGKNIIIKEYTISISGEII